MLGCTRTRGACGGQRKVLEPRSWSHKWLCALLHGKASSGPLEDYQRLIISEPSFQPPDETNNPPNPPNTCVCVIINSPLVHFVAAVVPGPRICDTPVSVLQARSRTGTWVHGSGREEAIP